MMGPSMRTRRARTGCPPDILPLHGAENAQVRQGATELCSPTEAQSSDKKIPSGIPEGIVGEKGLEPLTSAM